MKFRQVLVAAAAVAFGACGALADTSSGPYKLVKTMTVGGTGRWDCATTDSDARRLYIPRLHSNTDRVDVYDLDSLQKVGEIPDTTGVHDVAIDPASGHGFTTNRGDNKASPPVPPSVTMFDTKTLSVIQKISVKGKPDEIVYDPATKHIFLESHSAPNLTVINGADGAIVATIDLGGAPEQGASDGAGHVFFNLEDKSQVAVVDANTNQVTAHWDLGDGKGPTGMGFDAKNHRIFSCCGGNGKMAILDSDSGKILATEPTGPEADGGGFDPETMEAFSANGDATLTVVKENDPNNFAVEQNVQTKEGARFCAVDTKTHNVILMTANFETQDPNAQQQRPTAIPDSFMILVVGQAQ